jgi:sugar phosphate permease
LSKLQLQFCLILLFPVGTRCFVAQAFYTLLTWLPTYMKEVLDFDVHKAGFIAVLPYLALTIVVIVSGFVADLFIGACVTPFHHHLPLAHLSSCAHLQSASG